MILLRNQIRQNKWMIIRRSEADAGKGLVEKVNPAKQRQ